MADSGMRKKNNKNNISELLTCITLADYPETVKIKKIVQENPLMKTFYLDQKMKVKPGEFVMVWLPGKDEKPFSPSKAGKELGISVLKRGSTTAGMFELKEGDLLGVRGPYGKGFNCKGVKKACLVGGGCGAGPLKLLAEALKTQGAKTTFILGAKTREELIFEKELEKECTLHITTDDGSKGEKGFATQAFEKLLEKEKFDKVFTCGPEIMMKKVVEACLKKKISVEASLERFMKCGFGVCGQCVIDDLRVCKDGPVFSGETLMKLKDFGNYARTKSGRKVKLADYGVCGGKE